MNGLISGKATISKLSVSLDSQENFKDLSDHETKIHLKTLSSMLGLLARTIYEKIPEVGRENVGLENYILSTASSLDAIVKKQEIETMKSEGTQIKCIIDPTDSGFPIVVRDFKYLEIDKRDAHIRLKNLPDDSSLIDNAEYHLFRASYPTSIIQQKLERNYYTSLQSLDIPAELKTYTAREVNTEKNGHLLFKKSFEKLDGHNNVPKFYTLYFTVTGDFARYFALTENTENPIGWQADLETSQVIV